MQTPVKVSQKQLFALYFAIMATGMGQTVVFAVIPMLGRELALDQLVVNLPFFGAFALKELAITSLTSIASLTFFIAAPYWGRRSDRVGRKPIIIIGLLGYTLGTLAFNGSAQLGLNGVLAGFGLYLMLMVTRILLVLVMSATHPAASAYMIDVTSLQKRTKGMGKMSAASQIGTMVGPALGTLVAISYLAPLYLQAFLTFVAAILVWRLLPDSGLDISKRRELPRLRYFDKRYRVYLGIGLVLYTMMGMVQQTLGFYFQDVLQLESKQAVQQFALAMVVCSSAMLFSQLVIVQRWNVHPMRLFRVGLPLVIAGYLLLANTAALFWLMVGMGLFGMGMGMASPGYNVTATMTVNHDEQGALAGLSASAPGMGYVIGPLLGGFIYSIEPSYTYWFAGLVLVPLFFYAIKLKDPEADAG
ncbi:MFS transporter [Oceanicoccus sp. KOV_DT_Chl]|uniref:MFS transporter n=1 Tax=Oceanicoccus sp. KOV_DT_Chl TaxID=1904639 RepID=UPI000C7D9D21|nr:MFS transporter [Oceanicoccus sp. KOV_DT_Chl]